MAKNTKTCKKTQLDYRVPELNYHVPEPDYDIPKRRYNVLNPDYREPEERSPGNCASTSCPYNVMIEPYNVDIQTSGGVPSELLIEIGVFPMEGDKNGRESESEKGDNG